MTKFKGVGKGKASRMKFSIPDPNKYRISDCGMYLIEKIAVPGPNAEVVYAAWEYKRVLYGAKSVEDAVAAIKNREADHLQREEKYWASREPDAKLVSHLTPQTAPSQVSSDTQ